MAGMKFQGGMDAYLARLNAALEDKESSQWRPISEFERKWSANFGTNPWGGGRVSMQNQNWPWNVGT